MFLTLLLAAGLLSPAPDADAFVHADPRFSPEPEGVEVGQARHGDAAYFRSEPLLDESWITETTATSLFAIDITDQTLLYEYNADQRIAPASTLKMLTALTALTVFDPDDVVQVSEADMVDTTVYANAQLHSGDQVTVRDLLAGVLIPSGGDASNALARLGGGQLGPQVGQSPTSRFVEEMNDIAATLGMDNSYFVNADGRDHPDQFTTARDMAIAGRAVLQDELLAEIVASSAWTITIQGPNARQYQILNTNQLLTAERVHGIKTGTTGEAGQAIVLATRRADHQIITVVMGSESRYDDTLALLDLLDNRVRWVEFGVSGDFPDVRDAAREDGFALIGEFVRPMLVEDAERVRAEMLLGPRPRGTLPVRWGDVVFLNDGEELIRLPVLQTRLSSD